MRDYQIEYRKSDDHRSITGNIKPCPFCGDGAHLWLRGYVFSQYFVECNTCGGSGPPTKKMHGAVLLWNRRHERPLLALPAPKTQSRRTRDARGKVAS